MLLRVLYGQVSFHVRIPGSGGGNRVDVGNPYRYCLSEVRESFVVRIMKPDLNKRSLIQS
jgi:hypothetical protein